MKKTKTEIASLTEAQELLISRDDVNTSKEYNASYKSLRTKGGERLPSNPSITYKDCGWVGWANFLRGEVKAEIASFTEAQELVISRDDINTSEEYKARYKQLKTKDGKNLYSHPERTFKHCGWKGWTNFLKGYPVITSFTEAKELLKSRDDINTYREYKASYKSLRTEEGKRLPSSPNKVYKDCGWGGWLNLLKGDPVKHSLEITSFTEARELVISRDDINTRIEYLAKHKTLRTKEGKGLPSDPGRFYKSHGWKSWPNFLRGDPEIASLAEATELLVSRDDINTQKEYNASYKSLRTKEGKRLPSSPNTYYKKWKGMPNFLKKHTELTD